MIRNNFCKILISCFCLLLLLSCLVGPASAQLPVEDGDYLGQISRIAIPGVPSPTAASLGQYANNVVSSFTGIPNINIPLYEASAGNLKLPISLSYNASGIKVADIASWVGLGWSLNCGGVITRNVRDLPDDKFNFGMGWLSYNYLIRPDGLIAGSQMHGYSPFAGNYNSTGLHMMRTPYNVIDTEPDIFYFNFNGHVGKFFFSQGSNLVDHTGQIAPEAHSINLIPYQDLKFSYTLSEESTTINPRRIKSFTVIDESGNTYYFDKTEKTIARSTGDSYYAPVTAPDSYTTEGFYSSSEYNSSWYLTKIKTIQNREIMFNYEAESYTQLLPDSYSVRSFKTNTPYVSYIDCSKPYDRPNASIAFHNENQVNALRLSSIEGPDFKIQFEALKNREDLIGSSALTSITVYAKSETGGLSFVKGIDFNHSYLQSPIDPDLHSYYAQYGNPNKRLKLDKIIEKDVEGNVLSPYKLYYNDTYALPNRFSPHQDFWGYFNNNTCNTLTPTVYIYPAEYGDARFSMFRKTDYAGTDEYIIYGADRTTNTAAALSGTLNKIIFPNGGYEEFTLGSNTFAFEDRNILGGGLRLEKSIRHDGISSQNDIVREYSYVKTVTPEKSSGILFNLPVFTYTENFLPYWNQFDPYDMWPALGGEFDPRENFAYYVYNLVITSAPNFTLSGYDGINIGYSEIKERIVGNGSTIRRYSTPGRALALNDVNGGDCNPEEDGYCDGLFYAAPVKYYYISHPCPPGSPTSLKDTIDVTGLQFTSNGYPFAPKLNYEWNRGLLLSEKVFNEQNVQVKETINEYELYTPNKQPPLYIWGLRKARMTNYRPHVGCLPSKKLIKFDVVAEYPVITNIAKVINKSTVKLYNAAGVEPFTTVKRYKYNGNQIRESEISIAAGGNERINKKYFYPMDYKLDPNNTSGMNSITLGILNLQTKHVISPVIQSYMEMQDGIGTTIKVTGGEFVAYGSSATVPEQIYQIETDVPVAGVGEIDVNSNNVSFSSLYKSVGSFKYDEFGNMGHYNKEKTNGNVYLWGYQHQNITAKVSNAKPDLVAYSSFETSDKGNWNYSGNNLYGSNAITGKAFYSLVNGGIYKSGLTASETYIVSYWSRHGEQIVTGSTSVITGRSYNGWTYYEHFVQAPVSATISVLGSGTIDELRLYPKDSQMTTYCYAPLIGLISSADEKGSITYYEYDAFQRLKCIKDQNGNIIKSYDYHYKPQIN
ncbi:hypothetical protein [Pedobacter hiemivivus]|uniref:RHS repeat protein n=1 Tax=Pedobacter hiemivivus TaxID=2530454 RepID=A0A4R0NGY7_9SPHI|nr:hypothetical protein [Pedobacter hiemivivus]TCC99448.1 hypothetical protein EZ444_01865 [Pedobacter hiemivivus]